MTHPFDHPDFDQHERVLFVHDEASGLRAIIAAHDSSAGPAAGGVRFWHYESDEEALGDVLRLSKGMSYKAIMAGLPLGGGKAVILADERKTKSAAMLRAFGHAVDQLNGAYIAAEDVGITTDDVAVMREATTYVAGLSTGLHASGDPSPLTARGVFLGMEAALAYRLRRDLRGARVGLLGLGAVGMKLATMLHETGAELAVADIDEAKVDWARTTFGARAMTGAALLTETLDILAPCALGGVLTGITARALRAKIVAGAANNQLASADVGKVLFERHILYAPDYVINAGGIINVAGEIAASYDRETSLAALDQIPRTLGEIFARAESQDQATNLTADSMARERLWKKRAQHRAA